MYGMVAGMLNVLWALVGCGSVVDEGVAERFALSGGDGRPDVVLMVADADAPSDGESVLVDHLRTGLGVDVAVAPPTAAVGSVDLIVISASVAPDDVDESSLADAGVPLLVLQSGLWEGLGFATGSTSAGSHDALEVVPAGREGSSEVTTERHQLTAGSFAGEVHYAHELVEGATPVATIPDRPDRAVGFRIDEGARRAVGRAAVRSAGLGFDESFYGEWNQHGWDLFDDTAAWLLGRSTERDLDALFVWGDAGTGNEEPHQPEWMERARLRALGFDVTLVRDQDVETVEGDDFDLVLVSKTVVSTAVGDRFKGTTAGVIFWEDNMQMLSMMATIDDDGADGTAWHAGGSQLHVRPGAEARAAGLSGVVDFYTTPGEITYAPAGSLPDDAYRIARFGDDPDDDRWAVYSFDRGDALADGTPSAGRRVYFGLYDDYGNPTFQNLTREGVALFDAQIRWLVDAGDGAEADEVADMTDEIMRPFLSTVQRRACP